MVTVKVSISSRIRATGLLSRRCQGQNCTRTSDRRVGNYTLIANVSSFKCFVLIASNVCVSVLTLIIVHLMQFRSLLLHVGSFTGNEGERLQPVFTARRNARIASAVLATVIPSVCPSVRLSVTRRYCTKTTARSRVQFVLSNSKMCLVV